MSMLTAHAADLRVQCYSDGNECEVTGEIAKRFEAANPGTKIIIDKVPYKAVVETLPVQLAAGEGGYRARHRSRWPEQVLPDLTPHLSAARQKAWQDNFASTLSWFRAGPTDKGIYGLMSQLTVTGLYVNKTLFEQAKVPMPPATATWDDWMAAAKKSGRCDQDAVRGRHGSSGHRFRTAGCRLRFQIFRRQGRPGD